MVTVTADDTWILGPPSHDRRESREREGQRRISECASAGGTGESDVCGGAEEGGRRGRRGRRAGGGGGEELAGGMELRYEVIVGGRAGGVVGHGMAGGREDGGGGVSCLRGWGDGEGCGEGKVRVGLAARLSAQGLGVWEHSGALDMENDGGWRLVIIQRDILMFCAIPAMEMFRMCGFVRKRTSLLSSRKVYMPGRNDHVGFPRGDSPMDRAPLEAARTSAG